MKRRERTAAGDEIAGNYDEGVITKVVPYEDGKGWSVSFGECYGIGMEDHGVEPKVGDMLRNYGSIGYPIHGQALNGVLLWYLSPEEEEARHARRKVEREARLLAEFDEKRDQLDADYEGLERHLKARMDRLRSLSPAFRWLYEPYEMFVTTQAQVLITWAGERAALGHDPEASLGAWWKINSAEHDPPYDYRTQLEMVPGWSDDHSVNTAGCAYALAITWLRDPEQVEQFPPAMAPLAGPELAG